MYVYIHMHSTVLTIQSHVINPQIHGIISAGLRDNVKQIFPGKISCFEVLKTLSIIEL